jgi:DNA/RNA-binding domain of Phe-tRNA-synthetase-like protein
MAHALFEPVPDWPEVEAMAQSLTADCWPARDSDAGYVDEALSAAFICGEDIEDCGRNQLGSGKAAVLDALRMVETAARRIGDVIPRWPGHWG